MNASFPVFVLEKDSGDVMRFRTIGEMQRQIERIDVENDEYRAWDSEGRELGLGVQDPVWLKLTPKSEAASTELKEILLAAGRRSDKEIAAVPLDVSELFDVVYGDKQDRPLKGALQRLRRLFLGR